MLEQKQYLYHHAGGVVRARKFADMSHGDIAIVDKRRPKQVTHNESQIDPKTCNSVDDIVDSGGTLCNAQKQLWMLSIFCKSIYNTRCFE